MPPLPTGRSGYAAVVPSGHFGLIGPNRLIRGTWGSEDSSVTNPGLAKPIRRKGDEETARLADLKARIDRALHDVDDALGDESAEDSRPGHAAGMRRRSSAA